LKAKRISKLPETEAVQVWRARLARSKDKREEWRESTIRFNMDAYENGAHPGRLGSNAWHEDDITVLSRKTFSSIRAGLPSLLYSAPKASLSPNRPIFTEVNGQPVDMSHIRAEAQELWLNHHFGASKGSRQARYAILEMYLALGVIKVGYRPTFADDELRGVVETNELGEITIGPNGDPVLASGEWLKDDETGEILRDEDGIPIPHPGTLLGEEFFVQKVDWDKMLFDPDGKEDYSLHSWVAEEWDRPLAEVQSDPRFPKSVRESIQPTHEAGSLDDDPNGLDIRSSRFSLNNSSAVTDDCKRVRGFDIYDFAEDRYMVMADSSGDKKNSNDAFLLDTSTPPGIFHGPYVVGKFNETPGKFYPVTDAEGMADAEANYNLAQSQVAVHGNHAKTRYLYDETTFGHEAGDVEKEKMQDGPDHCMIEVASGTQNTLVEAPRGSMDGSFFARIPQQAQDFNEIAGGQASIEATDTATQANILASGAEVRNSDRRDNLVQEFLADVFKKLLESGKANADLTTYARIKRPDDPERPWDFRAIEPSQLQQGDFDVDIAVGSTLRHNDPRLAQQMLQFLQIAGQAPGVLLATDVTETILDSMNLDPKMSQSLRDAAKAMMEAQQKGGAGAGGDGVSQVGQVSQVPQGGGFTGAPSN